CSTGASRDRRAVRRHRRAGRQPSRGQLAVNSEPLLLAETFDRGRGALLTLNRPQVHNALSTSLAKAILGELVRLDEQPSLRCVILTGSGTRAFCAGADLKER